MNESTLCNIILIHRESSMTSIDEMEMERSFIFLNLIISIESPFAIFLIIKIKILFEIVSKKLQK